MENWSRKNCWNSIRNIGRLAEQDEHQYLGPAGTGCVVVAMSVRKLNRRTFLKRTAAAAAPAAASYWLGGCSRVSRSAGKKVIVIGIDGMDPVLAERMMREGRLPNFARLRAAGGFSRLGTSTPPQSPVAWAN